MVENYTKKLHELTFIEPNLSTMSADSTSTGNPFESFIKLRNKN